MAQSPKPPSSSGLQLPRLRMAPIRHRDSLALDGRQVNVRGRESPIEIPPYITWPEFQSWLSDRWKAGEHMAMASTTESGKTTLAIRLLHNRDFVVVMGTKRRDPSLYKPLEKMGFVRRDDWHPLQWIETGERYVIFAPTLEVEPGMSRLELAEAEQDQADAFRRALLEVYNVGGWTVYLDEIAHLSQELKLQRDIELLYREARSEGVTMIAGTQRPRNVPIVMFALANWFISFRISDAQDRDRASEFVGHLGDIFDETAARLPRFEFVAVHKPTDSIVRSRVEL